MSKQRRDNRPTPATENRRREYRFLNWHSGRLVRANHLIPVALFGHADAGGTTAPAFGGHKISAIGCSTRLAFFAEETPRFSPLHSKAASCLPHRSSEHSSLSGLARLHPSLPWVPAD